MIRCYVAAPLPSVRGWRDAGAVPPGVLATAVTAAVHRALPDADDEEREDAAAWGAVDRADTTARPLAVVALDASPGGVSPVPGDDAALRLDAPVPVLRWAAVFLVTGPQDDPALAWYSVAELDAIT